MNEIAEFVTFLAKERNDSPHTVKAYERDLDAFAAFCQDYYGGPWSWAGVDRLAVRGFLASEQQRGLGKRSVGRALSALRTFYRFLNVTRGLEVNPARATRTPKFDRTLPGYLDRKETDELFKNAEQRASAGGFTGIAAKNSVNLRRESAGKIQMRIFPVADISEGRSPNVMVLPGDVLVVDERVF